MNEQQEQKVTSPNEGQSRSTVGLGVVDDLRTEADLCRNEGADDIAILLDRAADEIDRKNCWLVAYYKEVRKAFLADRYEIERLRNVFRVNMLRLAPETPHSEIDRILNAPNVI